MTVRMPGDMSEGRATDLGRLAEDDLLLDQLGRGEQPTECDDLVAALSEWRTALPDADLPDGELTAAAVSAVRRSRRSARWARRSLVLATAGLLTFGGLAAAAQSAGPASPLWPVTTLLYPDLAESRAAIDQGRYEPASGLLDHASALVDQVDDPVARDQRRDEIAVLRAELPAPRDTRLPGGAGEPGSGARNSMPNVPHAAPPPTSAPTLNEGQGTGGPAVPPSTGTEVPGDLPLPAPVPTPSLVPDQTTPAAPVPNLPGRQPGRTNRLTPVVMISRGRGEIFRSVCARGACHRSTADRKTISLRVRGAFMRAGRSVLTTLAAVAMVAAVTSVPGAAVAVADPGHAPAAADAVIDVRDAATVSPTAVSDIVFGKLLSGGQTCIAPDYALAHESEIDTVVASYDRLVKAAYPDGPTSEDYTSIIDDKQYKILTSLIESKFRSATQENPTHLTAAPSRSPSVVDHPTSDRAVLLTPPTAIIRVRGTGRGSRESVSG